MSESACARQHFVSGLRKARGFLPAKDLPTSVRGSASAHLSSSAPPPVVKWAQRRATDARARGPAFLRFSGDESAPPPTLSSSSPPPYYLIQDKSEGDGNDNEAKKKIEKKGKMS